MAITAVELNNEMEPDSLIFNYGKNGGALSERQVEYYKKIKDLEQAMSSIFQIQEVKTVLLKKLREFAERILTNDNPDYAFVDAEYQTLLNEVSTAARDARRTYISQVRKQSIWLLAIGVFCIILSYVAGNYEDWFLNHFGQISDVEVLYFREFTAAFGFALIGLFVGVNLMALYSNRISGVVEFFDTQQAEVAIGLQLWYLAILLLVFLLVLAWELVQVGVGARLLNDFVTREASSGIPSYGIIVGILVSFAEPRIMEMLTKLFDPRIRSDAGSKP